MPDPIYLDYNATTPIDPLVLETMLPFLQSHFGNASSAHVYGRRAHEAIDQARGQLARLIGAASGEIIFTGCATEANNLAILGVARALHSTRRHLVTSAIEHPAVQQPVRRLEADGWAVTFVPVDASGRVDPDQVGRAIRDDTALVSIMHANNEIGTIQDIAAIARLARSRGALIHTDAAQTVGKITVDVDALGVDLLSIAGHKFYAPKGIGALYVRQGTPIAPALVGADHERGLRPGTENVASIVALGAAAQLARTRLPAATARLQATRDALHDVLTAKVDDLVLNGHREHRLPNTLNVSFPGVDGRILLQRAELLVAASVGSACHADSEQVSGVLAALGIGFDRARGAVRLSTGWATSAAEVARAAEALAAAWDALRGAQPMAVATRH